MLESKNNIELNALLEKVYALKKHHRVYKRILELKLSNKIIITQDTEISDKLILAYHDKSDLGYYRKLYYSRNKMLQYADKKHGAVVKVYDPEYISSDSYDSIIEFEDGYKMRWKVMRLLPYRYFHDLRPTSDKYDLVKIAA